MQKKEEEECLSKRDEGGVELDDVGKTPCCRNGFLPSLFPLGFPPPPNHLAPKQGLSSFSLLLYFRLLQCYLLVYSYTLKVLLVLVLVLVLLIPGICMGRWLSLGSYVHVCIYVRMYAVCSVLIRYASYALYIMHCTTFCILVHILTCMYPSTHRMSCTLRYSIHAWDPNLQPPSISSLACCIKQTSPPSIFFNLSSSLYPFPLSLSLLPEKKRENITHLHHTSLNPLDSISLVWNVQYI